MDEPKCPICYIPFSQGAIATSGAWMCTNCGHMWQITNGQVVAMNSTGHPVSAEAAALVVRYADDCPPAPVGAPAPGPLTAERARPFIPKEIG